MEEEPIPTSAEPGVGCMRRPRVALHNVAAAAAAVTVAVAVAAAVSVAVAVAVVGGDGVGG